MSKINGTVKVKVLPTRSRSSKEYLVIVNRGSEEKLLEKLGGDITNLVTFCDNKYNFEDRVERHYGGSVTKGVVHFVELFGKVQECFFPEKEITKGTKRAFKVCVHID